jgi:hypothetical protein
LLHARDACAATTVIPPRAPQALRIVSPGLHLPALSRVTRQSNENPEQVPEPRPDPDVQFVEIHAMTWPCGREPQVSRPVGGREKHALGGVMGQSAQHTSSIPGYLIELK